jgi:hypothetical protein
VIPALRRLRQEDQKIQGQPGLLSEILPRKKKKPKKERKK